MRTSTAVPSRPHRTAAVPVRHSGPVATQLSGPQPRPAAGRSPLESGSTAWLRGTEGRRQAPFVLFVLGLILATTLGLLFLNTAINVDSLRASQLRTENAARAAEAEQLQQQVTAGSTAAQLAQLAAELGLVPAGTAAHLVLDPDGDSALVGTAVPAPAPAPPPGPEPAPTGPAPTGPAPTGPAPAGPAPTEPGAAAPAPAGSTPPAAADPAAPPAGD